MAAKDNEQKTGEDQQDNAGPMLDMSQTAVKKDDRIGQSTRLHHLR